MKNIRQQLEDLACKIDGIFTMENVFTTVK